MLLNLIAVDIDSFAFSDDEQPLLWAPDESPVPMDLELRER